MKIIKIRKTGNKFRIIYKPSREEKQELKKLLPELRELVDRHCINDVVYAFIKNKNCVLNAMSHAGDYTYTLSFDLQNFFDSVTPDKVQKYITDDKFKICFPDGVAHQGLPTSPHMANLAAANLDKKILDFIKLNSYNCVYTRYADDLTFSFSQPDLIKILKEKLPQFVESEGFILNRFKTKLYSEKGCGRRIITGIAVKGENIYPRRKTKKKMRAAVHQNKMPQMRGLWEFMQLKVPKRVIKIAKILTGE